MAILCPNKLNIEVTLINKTKYFEVYVDVDPEYTHQYKNLPAVRNEIKCAMGKVLEKMSFEYDCEKMRV